MNINKLTSFFMFAAVGVTFRLISLCAYINSIHLTVNEQIVIFLLINTDQQHTERNLLTSMIYINVIYNNKTMYRCFPQQIILNLGEHNTHKFDALCSVTTLCK